MSTYAFDSAWEQERTRLIAGEQIYDPTTLDRLNALGIAEGARCWEIGAGSGSVARWLADQVGSSGHVLATDIDTRFLESDGAQNLEVREHDVAADPVESEAFDLIHARLVLEHIPARLEVLPKLASALRPGGWLMIESMDQTDIHLPTHLWSVWPLSDRELFCNTARAVCRLLAGLGIDVEFGRELPRELLAAGLQDVEAICKKHLIKGQTPAAEHTRLVLEFLREPVVAHGLLSEDEVERILVRHRDPDAAWMGMQMVTAWGRRAP